MRDDDPTLDAALAALAGVEPPALEDDDRWAKRVASKVSNFAPMSRRELDPILEAPLPDDHQDFDGGIVAADDHGHADHTAAAAADFGDARGWEGSMSDDASSSRPPNSLAGLSGLTRSGPSSTSASAEPLDGAAKGDDSGLIDLRAMSNPEPQPVEPAAAAAAAVVADEAPPASLGKPAPVAASAASPATKVAAVAAAPMPPSSTAATAAAPAAAAPRKEEKKGGVVIWLAVAGVAAAAAAALFTVGPLAKKDDTSTASAPAAQQDDKKKPEAEKVAAAEKPAPSVPVEPQASAEPAPNEEPQAAGTVAKPGGPAAGGTGKVALAPDPKAGTAAAKPTASAAPTATEAPKSAGTGSLDEVLGIGKDQPAAKATASDNLPDKPDSMDVRSAINGKVSSATACVKGLDAPSNVAVTFGPGGAVSGVVVTSGPAKGTGAESCIKNAFSSAKVPPSKKGATGSASLVP